LGWRSSPFATGHHHPGAGDPRIVKRKLIRIRTLPSPT
jgi:hypothetical protein